MVLHIKEVMKNKGFTVQEVADRMGISRVGLSQHINGNPSVEVLERIAIAIGCKVGDFFDSSKDNTISCPNCGATLKIHVEVE
jgi:transcriptional regulator with XRE-family HTH domain